MNAREAVKQYDRVFYEPLPAALNKLRDNKSAVLVDEIPATLEQAVCVLEGV